MMVKERKLLLVDKIQISKMNKDKHAVYYQKSKVISQNQLN